LRVLDRPFERREFRASIGEWPLGIPEAESQRAFLHFVTESDYSSFVDRFTEKILKPIVMALDVAFCDIQNLSSSLVR
jgi:hypothetical protein